MPGYSSRPSQLSGSAPNVVDGTQDRNASRRTSDSSAALVPRQQQQQQILHARAVPLPSPAEYDAMLSLMEEQQRLLGMREVHVLELLSQLAKQKRTTTKHEKESRAVVETSSVNSRRANLNSENVREASTPKPSPTFPAPHTTTKDYRSTGSGINATSSSSHLVDSQLRPQRGSSNFTDTAAPPAASPAPIRSWQSSAANNGEKPANSNGARRLYEQSESDVDRQREPSYGKETIDQDSDATGQTSSSVLMGSAPRGGGGYTTREYDQVPYSSVATGRPMDVHHLQQQRSPHSSRVNGDQSRMTDHEDDTGDDDHDEGSSGSSTRLGVWPGNSRRPHHDDKTRQYAAGDTSTSLSDDSVSTTDSSGDSGNDRTQNVDPSTTFHETWITEQQEELLGLQSEVSKLRAILTSVPYFAITQNGEDNPENAKLLQSRATHRNEPVAPQGSGAAPHLLRQISCPTPSQSSSSTSSSLSAHEARPAPNARAEMEKRVGGGNADEDVSDNNDRTAQQTKRASVESDLEETPHATVYSAEEVDRLIASAVENERSGAFHVIRDLQGDLEMLQHKHDTIAAEQRRLHAQLQEQEKSRTEREVKTVERAQNTSPPRSNAADDGARAFVGGLGAQPQVHNEDTHAGSSADALELRRKLARVVADLEAERVLTRSLSRRQEEQEDIITKLTDKNARLKAVVPVDTSLPDVHVEAKSTQTQHSESSPASPPPPQQQQTPADSGREELLHSVLIDLRDLLSTELPVVDGYVGGNPIVCDLWNNIDAVLIRAGLSLNTARSNSNPVVPEATPAEETPVPINDNETAVERASGVPPDELHDHPHLDLPPPLPSVPPIPLTSTVARKAKKKPVTDAARRPSPTSTATPRLTPRTASSRRRPPSTSKSGTSAVTPRGGSTAQKHTPRMISPRALESARGDNHFSWPSSPRTLLVPTPARRTSTRRTASTSSSQPADARSGGRATPRTGSNSSATRCRRTESSSSARSTGSANGPAPRAAPLPTRPAASRKQLVRQVSGKAVSTGSERGQLNPSAQKSREGGSAVGKGSAASFTAPPDLSAERQRGDRIMNGTISSVGGQSQESARERTPHRNTWTIIPQALPHHRLSKASSTESSLATALAASPTLPANAGAHTQSIASPSPQAHSYNRQHSPTHHSFNKSASPPHQLGMWFPNRCNSGASTVDSWATETSEVKRLTREITRLRDERLKLEMENGGLSMQLDCNRGPVWRPSL